MLLGAINFGIPGVIGAALVAETLIYPVLVRLTRRYGAWDWRQDAGFACLAVLILTLTLWRNPAIWSDFTALAGAG
jgi:hypothetical protein